MNKTKFNSLQFELPFDLHQIYLNFHFLLYRKEKDSKRNFAEETKVLNHV